MTLPASPPIVAAYLAHLAEERRMSVAHRPKLHKAALAADPQGRTATPTPPTTRPVKQIMKGIARAQGRPQKQAKPLTAEALAAVKATAKEPAMPWAARGNGRSRRSGLRMESPGRRGIAGHPAGRVTAPGRGRGPDLERHRVQGRRRRPAHNCARSKTDQEAEGVVLYVGQGSGPGIAGHPARARAAGSRGIGFRDDRPPHRQPGQGGRRGRRPGRRVYGPQRAASAWPRTWSKAESKLPALMTAGRWKSSKMPARYTERQAADRGAVARYYQESGG